MAQNLASLILPAPPSWYPGHMKQFVGMLPALLSRTDVVLELRDARLPLTSVNSTFEGVLNKWREERRRLAHAFASSSASANGYGTGPSLKGHSSLVSERIIVMNKRDLVPEWGIEPYRRAMLRRFPDQNIIFASWNRPRDVKNLYDMIVNIAKDNAHVSNELNVLVVGMPNVGKSTLLNALRHLGIPGPTAKALRTSAHPGLTRALSTRLKLSQDPLVYSFDSPGVMLPFLGKGDLGAERGVKLALIAGIREGFYSEDTLAQYLLHRLNLMSPSAPAYLSILPRGTPPVDDVYKFLDLLARRLNMLKRGGETDVERAATWFVKWWREEGCVVSSTAPFSSASVVESPSPMTRSTDAQTHYGGWGFDFQWEVNAQDISTTRADPSGMASQNWQRLVQSKMEGVIDEFVRRTAEEAKDENAVSNTQLKKRLQAEKRAKRDRKVKGLLAARRSGSK